MAQGLCWGIFVWFGCCAAAAPAALPCLHAHSRTPCSMPMTGERCLFTKSWWWWVATIPPTFETCCSVDPALYPPRVQVSLLRPTAILSRLSVVSIASKVAVGAEGERWSQSRGGGPLFLLRWCWPLPLGLNKQAPLTAWELKKGSGGVRGDTAAAARPEKEGLDTRPAHWQAPEQTTLCLCLC